MVLSRALDLGMMRTEMTNAQGSVGIPVISLERFDSGDSARLERLYGPRRQAERFRRLTVAARPDGRRSRPTSHCAHPAQSPQLYSDATPG